MIELTSDQKLEIRNSQLQIMSIREQIRSMQDAAVKIEQTTIAYLNKIATDSKIDMTIYSFDSSTLVFVRKEDAARTESV